MIRCGKKENVQAFLMLRFGAPDVPTRSGCHASALGGFGRASGGEFLSRTSTVSCGRTAGLISDVEEHEQKLSLRGMER